MSHASQPTTVSSLLHDDQSSSPSIDSHATAAAAVDSAPSSQETSKAEDERCISVHSTSPSSQAPSSIDMDSSASASVETPAVHSSLFGSSSIVEAVNEALEKVGSELHDLSAAVVAPAVADAPSAEARAEEPAAQPEPAPAAQSSSLFSGFSSAFNAMATKVGSALSGSPDSAEADPAPAQDQAQPAAAESDSTPTPAPAAAQTQDESSDAADPTTPTQAGFDAESNGFHLPKATELDDLVQVVSGFIGGQPIIDSVLGDPKPAQDAEEKIPEPVILQQETAEHKEAAPAQEESKEEAAAAPAQPFDPWFDRAPEEAKEESHDAPKDAPVEESCLKELDKLVQVVSGIVGGQPIIDSVLGDPKPAQEEEEKIAEPVILQQETAAAESEHKEAAPAQEKSKEETAAAPAQPFDPWFDRAPEEASAEKKEAEETHAQPQEASADAEKAPAQPFDPWFDRAPEEAKEESHDAPKDAPVEEPPCVKEEAVLQFAEEATPSPAVCPAAPHDHELTAAQDVADHALHTDPPVQTLIKELDEAAPVEEQAQEQSAVPIVSGIVDGHPVVECVTVENAVTPTSDAASEESFELVHEAPQAEKSDEEEFHDAHEDHEEDFATGETPEPFEEVPAHEEHKAAQEAAPAAQESHAETEHKEEAPAQEAHAELEHKEEAHEEPKAAQDEAHAEPEHKEEVPAQEAHAEPEHKEEAHEEPKAAQEDEKIPEPVLHQETHAEPKHKEEAHEEPKAAQEEAHAEPEHKDEAPAQEAHPEPEHKEEAHEEPEAAQEEAPAEPEHKEEHHEEPKAAKEEGPAQEAQAEPEHKEESHEEPKAAQEEEKMPEPVLHQETHAEPDHKEEAHEEPKAAQEEVHTEPEHKEEAHAEPEHKDEAPAQETHAEPEHKEEAHEEPKAAQEEVHTEPEHKEEAPAQEAHAEPEHKEGAHEEPKAAQEEEKMPEPVLHQETHAEPELKEMDPTPAVVTLAESHESVQEEKKIIEPVIHQQDHAEPAASQEEHEVFDQAPPQPCLIQKEPLPEQPAEQEVEEKIAEPVLHQETHAEPQHKEEAYEEPKAAQEEAHAEPEHKEEAHEEPKAAQEEVHAEPEHKEEAHEEPKAAQEEEKIPEPVLHQETHAEPKHKEETHEEPKAAQEEVHTEPEHKEEAHEEPKAAQEEAHAEPEHKEEAHEEPKAAQEEVHAEPEHKEMDPTPAEVTPAETKEEAAAAPEEPKVEDAEEESFSKVTVAVTAAAAAGVAAVAAASTSSSDASPILADSHGEKDVGPSSHSAETPDEAFDASHDDEGQSSSRKKREAGFTDYVTEEEASVVEVQGLQTESPSNGEVQVFEDRVDDEEDPEDDRVPVKTMFDRSVKKPVPYRSLLQEKIEPGQTLIVKGSTIDESQRFTINLHSKSADFSGNDVPLHISFRFDEGKVVMNTFHNGEWGKEERKSNPLKKGDSFDIRIRAHDDRFQVVIDQKEFRDFEHRLPLTSISHLSIDGDLYLNHVHWGGKYYPVPYESGIANGFPVGKSLLIFGAVEKKGKRFNVNLLRKNGDIALHFNPRLDEKVVVRNSLEENQWGNEEREGKIPFEKGMGFDLAITNEAYAFQIFVNGERFATFAHRTDPNDITGLQIQGDIELTGIQIQ